MGKGIEKVRCPQPTKVKATHYATQPNMTPQKDCMTIIARSSLCGKQKFHKEEQCNDHIR